ncbi:alcohol dehydrogenase transcription factor myb/SANT-like domain-containing protein [Ditylenchus destructor]|nr:alcohol dehydrogenase transcription factor myb/SANT-like domain-containing protein [Ditylenchus destructor]
MRVGRRNNSSPPLFDSFPGRASAGRLLSCESHPRCRSLSRFVSSCVFISLTQLYFHNCPLRNIGEQHAQNTAATNRSQHLHFSRNMSNWNDTNRLRLITEYKRRPYLWQTSHADFSNMEKRREGLMQITVFINQFEKHSFSEIEVRNQFKNMKDMFRRKIKRIRQMEEMNMPAEEPTWAYYKHLKFLDEGSEAQTALKMDLEEDSELTESTGPHSIMDDLLQATMATAGDSEPIRRRSKRHATNHISVTADDYKMVTSRQANDIAIALEEHDRDDMSNIVNAQDDARIMNAGQIRDVNRHSCNGVEELSPSPAKRRPFVCREEIEDDFACFGHTMNVAFTNVEITDLRVWHCDDSTVLGLATRILAEETNVTRIKARIIDAISSDPELSEKNQVDWSVRYGRTVANLTPLRRNIKDVLI